MRNLFVQRKVLQDTYSAKWFIILVQFDKPDLLEQNSANATVFLYERLLYIKTAKRCVST